MQTDWTNNILVYVGVEWQFCSGRTEMCIVYSAFSLYCILCNNTFMLFGICMQLPKQYWTTKKHRIVWINELRLLFGVLGAHSYELIREFWAQRENEQLTFEMLENDMKKLIVKANILIVLEQKTPPNLVNFTLKLKISIRSCKFGMFYKKLFACHAPSFQI